MAEFRNFLASPNRDTMPWGADAVLFNVLHHAPTVRKAEGTVKLVREFGVQCVFVDSSGFEVL